MRETENDIVIFVSFWSRLSIFLLVLHKEFKCLSLEDDIGK